MRKLIVAAAALSAVFVIAAGIVRWQRAASERAQERAVQVAAAPSPQLPQGHGLQGLDPFRHGAPLDAEPRQPAMARVENADLRRLRGWPEQPPTIPHSIDGYQIDANFNHCMSCHSRAGAEMFQAPMVSVTHFMDREAQVLAQIAPRRYFCTQCHVVQTDARPLVASDFVDVDTLMRRAQPREE